MNNRERENNLSSNILRFMQSLNLFSHLIYYQLECRHALSIILIRQKECQKAHNRTIIALFMKY